MNFDGQKVLITTTDWFYAPDGQSYKAVWGTAKMHKSEDLLGVKPHNYANWFAVIDDIFLVAGCQIHYVMRCDKKPMGVNVYIPSSAPSDQIPRLTYTGSNSEMGGGGWDRRLP